jgi:UDP-2,3-diacylglucosamine hydrolase
MAVMSGPGDNAQSPLAIIGAGGSLPFAVADAVKATGRPFVLFALEGVTDATRTAAYPHRWVAVGQGGKLIKEMRAHGCRDIVFIGSLLRPPVWKMRLGLSTLLMIPTILSVWRGGDDHLLKGVSRIAERYGFRVVAAHEVAPNILMPEGQVTKREPSGADLEDIALGIDLLRAIGPYDVGQAVIVAARHVLAVEGAEGTDGMLERVAELRRRGQVHSALGRGVLVKAPKPDQDRRFDLPGIGPKTVAAARAAGLGGIAVIAGEAVVAEPEALAKAADEAGLFVIGLRAS